MWSWLASLLTGPIIKSVLDGYKAKLDAGNTSERLAVDLAARELAVQQAEDEQRTRLLIAEQGNWLTRMVRPLFALPFIVFAWKIVVYDKVLGLGVTDPLDEKMWSVFMAIVIAFFGGRSAEKVATTVASVFKRK